MFQYLSMFSSYCYSVVVWNVATGDAICGSPAQVNSAGMTHTVCYANNSDDIFVTGGK